MRQRNNNIRRYTAGLFKRTGQEKGLCDGTQCMQHHPLRGHPASNTPRLTQWPSTDNMPFTAYHNIRGVCVCVCGSRKHIKGVLA